MLEPLFVPNVTMVKYIVQRAVRRRFGDPAYGRLGDAIRQANAAEPSMLNVAVATANVAAA
jgi:hypothetical protein